LPDREAEKMCWLTRWLFGHEEKSWQISCRKGVPKSYRRFLRRFPKSQHQEKGRGRLGELEWDVAHQTESIQAHRDFLSEHPRGIHAEKATKRIGEIQTERQAPQAAAERIFTKSVQVSVHLGDSGAGCTVRISAHFLEACSADHKDPAVRGAYASHAGLYEYVKRRIAQIYRAAFTAAPTLRFAQVIVECKHGVRRVAVGGPGGW
jgi:hypothetical protein